MIQKEKKLPKKNENIFYDGRLIFEQQHLNDLYSFLNKLP